MTSGDRTRPFTPLERAAFERYAEQLRGRAAEHGIELGPAGSKVAALGVLILRAAAAAGSDARRGAGSRPPGG